jgi:RNA polymerase sigma-70 factor (ECF subfamily)
MQDAVRAFVLDSEAAQQANMNDTPRDTSAEMPEALETDEQLIVAHSQGSSDAFNLLFLRYKQPLFGFFRRRVNDPSLAEEMTQESFLAVLRASSRYKASALFRTYLYAIGYKILRAHRRKAAFRATFSGAQPDRPEPAVESGIAVEVSIRQALGKLVPMDREVLMLREFEDLSYAEIAQLLGLPINTVRSRLFRARLALRDLLTGSALESPTRQHAESEKRS